ncbi:conserved hypothetical protein [Culex quinquefasciatus]|uniref:Uncharacterized protein n=1 Tax=Culex quinquefasciatus TaxID=7176 RepID=B0X6K6_CULQU|nr:conserved hypothetical protein [Culex quinquefasciatus]|eukprot:XP_001865278.1 conserved hypothetical protein [Culex quinquefasciatus]
MASVNWAQFDRDLEELTKWCRSMEIKLRNCSLNVKISIVTIVCTKKHTMI